MACMFEDVKDCFEDFLPAHAFFKRQQILGLLKYVAVGRVDQTLDVASFLAARWLTDSYRLLLHHHANELHLVAACHQCNEETAVI